MPDEQEYGHWLGYDFGECFAIPAEVERSGSVRNQVLNLKLCITCGAEGLFVLDQKAFAMTAKMTHETKQERYGERSTYNQMSRGAQMNVLSADGRLTEDTSPVSLVANTSKKLYCVITHLIRMFMLSQFFNPISITYCNDIRESIQMRS